MSSLSIHLLGSPRIEVNGRPITVDTRKAVALLAYLATTPGEQREHREHRRESLAALLWPEVDQSHAFSALRRTLSALNKAIGGQGLIIERESIALAAGVNIWIDTAEFKQR